MLGYALDDQLLHADLFVRIFGLIPILKNGFLGIFIDSGINLQRAFAVPGKGDNDIANLALQSVLITTRSPLSIPASTMESPEASRI